MEGVLVSDFHVWGGSSIFELQNRQRPRVTITQVCEQSVMTVNGHSIRVRHIA